jgi:transcriptional regulator with XRE-family HTH domain
MGTFGQLISQRRRQLGLSQKQLAELVRKDDGKQISPQYVNDLERDRRNAPSEHLIRQFSKVLDIDEDHLWLAAGMMPSDIRQHSGDEPETLREAFSAFRKVLRRQGK